VLVVDAPILVRASIFLRLVLSCRAAETFTVSEELQTAASWFASGRKVALGTVIRTWGSAPRPAGSQIAVRDDGAFLGSVSGGCVEGAVIEAALESIADGKSRDLEFGVTDAQAWEVGLACGGRIQIRVEAVAE
jgi:xanthine/CO dehydrogenase XdhC/CoxF family maturation factor